MNCTSVPIVIAQDIVFRVLAAGFSRPQQHFEHGYETSDRNGAGCRDDHEITEQRPCHMVFHDALRLLSLGAYRCHFLVGDLLAVVAPRTALIIDDVRDVGVVERPGEIGHLAVVFDATHRRPFEAEQDGMDMRGRICIIDHRISFERGKCTGQTLARFLMTNGAMGTEELLSFFRVVARGRPTASGNGRRLF